MTLSGQDLSPKSGGRSNQKARTRAALLQAAEELVAEGRPPSVPEAAERALVSVATAYRYFSSAEELWWEASEVAVRYAESLAEAEQRIEAAGPDLKARLEALIRVTSFAMLENQVPYRQIARNSLEQWFRQVDGPEDDRAPVRLGRRNAQIRNVITPLEGQIPKKDLDRIAHALGLIVGTEAMISLIDAVGLEVPEAKETLLDASRWLLTGALTELADLRP
jgi:AcrR family transcriptional regulator